MKITISGYGGEVTLGSITQEQYVYWKLKDNEDDINNLLMGWPEECEEEHPESLMLGQYHDMDDIAHANGATFDSAYITVTNDDGDIIWEGEPSKIEELPNGDNLIAREDEYYFSETDHKHGIYCCSSEKGVFTEIEVKGVNEFDPSRLRMYIEDIEGDRIITSIEYEGAEFESTDDYSTNGKGFEWSWLTNVED